MVAADKFSEGMRRLRAGDYEAAAREFSLAITIDPDHRSAYYSRAEAYRNLGLEELARADLEYAEFLMMVVRVKSEEENALWTPPEISRAPLRFLIYAIFGGIIGAIMLGAIYLGIGVFCLFGESFEPCIGFSILIIYYLGFFTVLIPVSFAGLLGGVFGVKKGLVDSHGAESRATFSDLGIGGCLGGIAAWSTVVLIVLVLWGLQSLFG